jgi:hydrogenase expression/formation protein HypE
VSTDEFTLSCPVLTAPAATIQLSQGGGGSHMRRLLDELFLPAFAGPELAERHDSAVVEAGGARLAFTTDSYVVTPLVFPGGDIGKLAVFGTVNDLAMAGAVPRWLSAGFILEEGLSRATLERVVRSMRDAAAEAGVKLVTGDTKVVDRGKCDGLFVNTAGIGIVPPGVRSAPGEVRPGHVVLLSGDVGRHGVAILSVREGLRFESSIESDCAPLSPAVTALTAAGVPLACLRDLTRGGLASALNEIAVDGHVGFEIEETAVPVSPAVAGACEILGLDPFYVANEGRMITVVPPSAEERALQVLRGVGVSAGAVRIGRATRDSPGRVILRGALGTRRILDLLSGEQLPRIC